LVLHASLTRLLNGHFGRACSEAVRVRLAYVGTSLDNWTKSF